MVEPPGRRRLAQLLHVQGEACARLGSPLYAALLARAADDVLAGGPVSAVLAGHEEDPADSALALRLMGGVHSLVLAGQAPDLARCYPSVGGRADPAVAWPAFLDVLDRHAEDVRAALESPPQTNEVGRAAALIGGLLHLAARTPGPGPLAVRLFEIGASGGLNLRADAFRVDLADGRHWGPGDSPVVLRGAWEGTLPPLDFPFAIVERSGSDVSPVDVGTAEGGRRLLSYVWPDSLERVARMRAALELAARIPAPVLRARASDAVARMQLRPGTTTVLWHSVMWQYLTDDERAAVSGGLEELGERTSPESRLARLTMEPVVVDGIGQEEFEVTLRTWPGGLESVLGTAAPHGLPVRWHASEG